MDVQRQRVKMEDVTWQVRCVGRHLNSALASRDPLPFECVESAPRYKKWKPVK